MLRNLVVLCLVTSVASMLQASTVFLPNLWNNYFSMSFDGFHDGDLLSDEGAKGGSWGTDPIPEGATATVTYVNGEKALSLKVGEDAWLKFTPTVQEMNSTKACLFRAKFTLLEVLPTLPEESTGAFTVAATNGVDALFMAYNPDVSKWFAMHPESGSATAAFDEWVDFSMCYRVIDSTRYVSYYLKLSTGQYVLLKADDDAQTSSFRIPSTTDAKSFKVMITGVGGVSDFSGTCQKGGAVTIR